MAQPEIDSLYMMMMMMMIYCPRALGLELMMCSTFKRCIDITVQYCQNVSFENCQGGHCFCEWTLADLVQQPCGSDFWNFAHRPRIFVCLSVCSQHHRQSKAAWGVLPCLSQPHPGHSADSRWAEKCAVLSLTRLPSLSTEITHQLCAACYAELCSSLLTSSCVVCVF